MDAFWAIQCYWSNIDETSNIRRVGQVLFHLIILIHVIVLIKRNLYFCNQTNEFNLKIILVVRFSS